MSGKWPRLAVEHGRLRVASWKGVPIEVHALAGLWFVYFFLHYKALAPALLAFVTVGALVLAHEFGHAFAARRRRVRVLGITLVLFYGECRHDEPYYETDDIYIAWGGVSVQAVILLLAWATQRALTEFGPFEFGWRLQPLFYVLVETNLFLIVFNLLPIPPLDGHRAWRILPVLWGRHGYTVRKALAGLNLKRRRQRAKVAEQVTAELFERLKKK